MKPIEVTSDSYAEYNEDSDEKDPKFKVGDLVRISKYKNIFAEGYTQNWSEGVFVVSKINDTVPWTYTISDLNGEPIIGSFYEKELQKTNQKIFRIEKLIKRKGDKADLSNYATKTDLKNLTHVDPLSFALKASLASLKTEVDKLDIVKLAPAPIDLSKLSDVFKNDVVKKAVYGRLAVEVNNIDSSEFLLKTKYQTDEAELEKKIPDITDFVKKTKLTELANKFPDVSSLAAKTALTAVENKIPSVGSLVKKTNYDTKINDLEKKLTNHNYDKYITTP